MIQRLHVMNVDMIIAKMNYCVAVDAMHIIMSSVCPLLWPHFQQDLGIALVVLLRLTYMYMYMYMYMHALYL